MLSGEGEPKVHALESSASPDAAWTNGAVLTSSQGFGFGDSCDWSSGTHSHSHPINRSHADRHGNNVT